MEIDSKPEVLDRLERRIIQLKIEQEALKKEKDEATKKRLATLQETLRGLEKEYSDLEEIWKSEKASLQGAADVREEQEKVKHDMEAARRKGDLTRVAQIQYEELPALERKLAQATDRRDQGNPARPQQGDRRGNRGSGFQVDRHSRLEDARGREGKTPAHGRGAQQARRRPGRSGEDRLERHSPFARRSLRSAPPEWFVPVPRAHGRRQDRALQGARGIPVRHRRVDGAHRHVRVHGETLRGAAHRRAAGIRGLRRRRPAHRSRAPPSLRRHLVRRGGEGAPGRVQRAAAGARRWAPHRRPGPHRGLPQHRDHHDVEPGVRRDPAVRGRGQLREDEVGGHGSGAAELPAGVHQPHRRHLRVPSAGPGADPRHRRHPARRSSRSGCSTATSSSRSTTRRSIG